MLHGYESSISDWRKPHMPRGNFMLGDMAVVISHALPKEHVADEIRRVDWPWWIEWPALAFGNQWFTNWPRRFVQGAKIERDQIVMAAGKIFMSPATWETLK